MFAVQFSEFGTPDVLEIDGREEPHAGPHQVRIRVKAAGVSPVDLGIRSGSSPSAAKRTLPHVPGVDAAGVVDEIGDGVTGVAIGDEVWGSIEITRLGGASAEFAVLAAWAPKPPRMTWAQAGAAGSSVETATRALDALDVREGQTLIIDGAAGGVGSVAVQLAVARGARVIGTASAQNQDFVTGLGAIATTYGAGLGAIATTYGAGLPARVRSIVTGAVDIALHTSGKGGIPELIEVTGSAASVVSIADFTAPSLGARVTIGEQAGEPSGWHGLAIANALFEAGKFALPVEAEFTMADAAKAHARASSGSRRGKIVLIAPENWS